MSFTWNLVTKNTKADSFLREKLRQKISKLDVHLQHFPQDAVHLQIKIEKQPRKELFSGSLTLQVPSNILRSQKSAPDPVTAFDHAVKALLREITSLKSELRGDKVWKNKERRAKLHDGKLTRFDTPAGHRNPPPPPDLPALVQSEQGRLLHHIQRQLKRYEAGGLVSQDAIDPKAVLDDAVRQALSTPPGKLANRNARLWFYGLARSGLNRRVHQFRDDARHQLSLDGAAPEDAGGPDTVDQQFEPPPVTLVGDTLLDSHTLAPDENAAHDDLVNYFQSASALWPAEARSVFELHFLQGFEPDEVAMLEHLSIEEVNALIGKVQDLLKEALRQANEITTSVASISPTRRAVITRPRKLPDKTPA